MARLAALAKFVKFEDGADDAAVKAAVLAKMEEEGTAAVKAEDGYNYDDAAGRLEEMAQAYEDAEFADDAETPQTLRKTAAKFRRMAAKPFAGKETPEEEAAEEAAKQEMAQRLGLPRTANARQIATAMEAKTTGLDKVGVLEQRIATMERTRNEEIKGERKRSASLEFAQAVDMGRTKEEKRTAFLTAYERNPKDAEALLFDAGTFPSRNVLSARMTSGGAPVGLDNPREGNLMTGVDHRVVTLSALGHKAKAVVFGEKLSHVVNELADSVEPRQKAKVDKELPEGVKGTKFESFERYLAAERIIGREHPELVKAASEEA